MKTNQVKSLLKIFEFSFMNLIKNINVWIRWIEGEIVYNIKQRENPALKDKYGSKIKHSEATAPVLLSQVTDGRTHEKDFNAVFLRRIIAF